jgi:hypothetical protein
MRSGNESRRLCALSIRGSRISRAATGCASLAANATGHLVASGGGGDVERLVQVYLEDMDTLTWTLWTCAWQDRAGKRYWKRTYLRSGVPIGEIRGSLEELLERARLTADAWRSGDLEITADRSTDL